jgi:hypothetical protein
LNRNYPRNPATQPVKGIFVFHNMDELASKAQALFKSLCCQVMATHENRFTVKTSRGNIQSIKQRWLANDLGNIISQELSLCVSQIIIGGAAT